MGKEDEERLWRELKTRKMHMELGYISVKMPIRFSGERGETKEFRPIFNTFESKVNNAYSSNVKSSKLPSASKDDHFGDSSVKSVSNANNGLSDA
jgi:hypothetical protein